MHEHENNPEKKNTADRQRNHHRGIQLRSYCRTEMSITNTAITLLVNGKTRNNIDLATKKRKKEEMERYRRRRRRRRRARRKHMMQIT